MEMRAIVTAWVVVLVSMWAARADAEAPTEAALAERAAALGARARRGVPGGGGGGAGGRARPGLQGAGGAALRPRRRRAGQEGAPARRHGALDAHAAHARLLRRRPRPRARGVAVQE